MRSRFIVLTCAAALAAASASAVHAFGPYDFGLFRDAQLDAHLEQLFGIVAPVDVSSTESIGAPT